VLVTGLLLCLHAVSVMLLLAGTDRASGEGDDCHHARHRRRQLGAGDRSSAINLPLCRNCSHNVLSWQSFDVTSTAGAGGVLTVTSELGEPIHKIANRGTRYDLASHTHAA
jgi:hypothetical protein